MRGTGDPHVSQVTRVDDEGNGPPEFMCHMWMRERPPMVLAGLFKSYRLNYPPRPLPFGV